MTMQSAGHKIGRKGIINVKRIFVWLIAVGILLGAGTAAYHHYSAAGSKPGTSQYRTAAVQRGEMKLIINSTGNVKPVRSVQIGSFVSGPIEKVLVDFNDRVTSGQLMAKVDPRLYKSAVAHEEAAHARCKADVQRIKALLAQATRNEERGKKLHVTKAISETDMDLFIAEKASLEAQLDVAEASVRESEANLATAKTNLEFTDITSPVDGIVTDRKIDPGQTVAAQFQTPTLFVVAPDLEKKVFVYASVDEADIGLIREAEKRDEPVTFTVDAYPNDLFEGKIRQVRLNPTTVQNVVTFTVVVAAANSELKLLPDMTANLSFQIEKKTDVLKVPNAAFRVTVKPEQVREQDRPILEELEAAKNNGKKDDDPQTKVRSRTHKYLWIVEGEMLAAVPVEIGINDKSFTEIIGGTLNDGQEIVVGLSK
jgi:HlyD family secretion protein